MGRPPPPPRCFRRRGWGWRCARFGGGSPPRRVPLLGLAAAFLFAAQMVNFPVAGGTSGHLVGGVLAAALLGPSAAIVVLTTVLIVQCFLFADGGVLALGANIFNMAIVGAAGGYAIYRVVCRALPGTRGQVAAVAFAGWCSTVLASICCAGQLAWSGTVAWPVALYGDDERAHGDWRGRRADQRAGVPGDPTRAARPDQRSRAGPSRRGPGASWCAMVCWRRWEWRFSWPRSPARGRMGWSRWRRSLALSTRPFSRWCRRPRPVTRCRECAGRRGRPRWPGRRER